MEKENNARLTPKAMRSVFVASFAAIISVSGIIAIPTGPLGVPVVLQNMMVVLGALVLGGIQGGAASGLFIAAGMLGLPVFAGGRSGVAALLSPTGGYIIGYFLGSLAAGLYAGKPSVSEKKFSVQKAVRIASSGALCMAIIYVLGTGYLMTKTNMPLAQAIAAGVIPYIGVDALKLAFAVSLAIKLRPIVARYIAPNDDAENAFGADGQ
jgi:biotin transport system substrate-specific component